MRPILALRVEGLAIALGAAGTYVAVGGDLVLFVLLVLLPDVSIAGYLAGPRFGSVAYNLIHGLTLPVLVLAWGLWTGPSIGVLVGLAWIAHVGADRALGLGLKYPDAAFRDTHLQRVGTLKILE
ncbi:MAG: DUF4260 family protein [Salinirussus sp.]